MSAGKYSREAKEAFAGGSWRGQLLIGTWLLYPVAVTMVIKPWRSIQLGSYMQGLDVPHVFTDQQLIAGEVIALFILASLSLTMFWATVLLYRKAGYWFRTWPLVAITVGFFGNLGWWIFTQHFDPAGALVGLSPLSFSVAIFAICEKKGREFVFGKGATSSTQRV
jgi:hypothetical protein